MKRLTLLATLFIAGNATAGTFNDADICRVSIATMNGHSAKQVKLISTKKDITTVGYTRDDGKKFKYQCTINGETIKWKDSSMNRWSKNQTMTKQVVPGGKINIILWFGSSKLDSKTWSKTDL